MSRSIARFFVILAVAILAVAVGWSQTGLAQQNQGTNEAPPDYRINASAQIDTQRGEILIRVTVYNAGGPAEEEATIALASLRTGDPIATDQSYTVRPLGANGDSEEVEIRLPLTTFPPESSQSIWVTVGIGEVEAENSATILNNRDGLNLMIPDYDPVSFVQTPPQEQPGTTPQTPAAEPQPEAEAGSRVVQIPIIDREIDLADPTNIIALVGIGAASVLMLLILSMILRLLFQRSPQFGNWQPPYATVPPLDPNSVYGRRQVWQQHAQNNVLPLPCKESVVHARKVLLGMDGYYLSGWKIKAARMTQYDMYGRVARSQVIATSGNIRRLNSVARRSASLDTQRISRRVRPVAKSLAKQFRKRITARSAMLPIALDVRFQGVHGEVRILFELYQCLQGQLHQIDIWEPEMTVVGRAIHESYTLTIYGQLGNEAYRDFRNRLQNDLTQVLTEMMLTQTVSVGGGGAPDTVTHTRPVQINTENTVI
ncbi:MAG: hypothetical protein SF029_07385 [bacterium]|nr:hypothetical protein [bacterium]